MAALRADYFGSASFGMITGISSMVVMIGMMAGPLVAGILADRTGSYQTGFRVLAVCAALGSIFFLLARRPEPPHRAPAGVPQPADATEDSERRTVALRRGEMDDRARARGRESKRTHGAGWGRAPSPRDRCFCGWSKPPT